MTEAAAKRRVTKSALSQQLKTLEARMGVVLFERSGRGLRPTAAALDLAVSLRQAFAIADEAVAAARESHETVQGELAIGAPRPFAQAKLTSVFSQLLTDHPRLLLDISFGTPTELEARLIAHDLDLAVLTRSPSDDHGGQLESTPLFVETFELVASPKYLARHGTPKSLDDLVGGDRHRFVVFDRDEPMHDAWLRATFGRAAANKQTTNIIARAASLDMMLTLTRAGAAMCVLPTYFIEKELAGGALTSIRIPGAKRAAKSTIHLAWRRGTPTSLRFMTVKAVLLGAFA